MEEKTFVYKSHIINRSLPSCKLDLEYLDKLLDILENVNNEAAKIEISKLEKKPEQSEKEFADLKEWLINLYQISIQIFGSKGEYILVEPSVTFDKIKFPNSIDKIIFDNSLKYNFNLKRDPMNTIKISFDFKKPPILDFITNPSYETQNFSNISISGDNDIWVSGADKKIMELFKDCRTNRGWLHKSNIYDLFLWFVFLPLSLGMLYKLDMFFFFKKAVISNVFIVTIYLYFFIIFINIFRMIFNYSKWIFPKVELIISNKSGAIKHRTFLFGLSGLILTPFMQDIYNIVKYICKSCLK
jgi:hypothetical protein